MDVERKYYVYHLIDSITNTTFYVGKGYGNRMYEHEKEVLRNKIPHNNKHLYYKILNILSNNGKIIYKKILENSSEQESLIVESSEISRLGREDLGNGKLCNLTDGGEGASGYKWNDEQKAIKKIQNKGCRNPMYGKSHSEKSKSEMSIKRNSRKFKFRHSDEHRKLLTVNNAGGKSASRPIYQIDLNNIIVSKWGSLSAAAKSVGLSKANIFTAIKNNWKSGNYKWKYV